jgi:hypothetical protein
MQGSRQKEKRTDREGKYLKGNTMKKQVEYLQRLFYDIWNDFGNVYLLVKYSSKTSIGKRGFTDDEMKKGLILVFNNKTNNKLDWDADGNLTGILAFGTRKEDVFIHHDDLLGVFSPEARVQFLRNDISKEPSEALETDNEYVDNKQVVSIINYKKRKSDEGP